MGTARSLTRSLASVVSAANSSQILSFLSLKRMPLSSGSANYRSPLPRPPPGQGPVAHRSDAGGRWILLVPVCHGIDYVTVPSRHPHRLCEVVSCRPSTIPMAERRTPRCRSAAASAHERPVGPSGEDSRSGTSYGEPTSQRRGPERPIGFCRTQPPRHATVVKRDGVGFHRDCIPPPPPYPQVSARTSPASTMDRTQTSPRIPHRPRTRPSRFARLCRSSL